MLIGMADNEESRADGMIPQERTFGWGDMVVHPDGDPRTDGGYEGERAGLVGCLRDVNGAVADPEVLAEAWETWRAEVAFAERFVDEASDLGITGTHGGDTISLRDVLVHMIAEYGRHNGHADFLRERIDGRVGQ